MVGENKLWLLFPLSTLKAFALALEKIFENGLKTIYLLMKKITTFVQSIYKSIELTKLFPEMHEEISEIYNFDNPAYRILIGKNYALFYRINESERTIKIGNMYHQKQMHLSF